MRGGRGGWDREEKTDTQRDGWAWGDGPVHVMIWGNLFLLVVVSLTGTSSCKGV